MRENTNRLRLFMLPTIDPNPDDHDRYRGIDRTTSEAAFGQVDWGFADSWTLSVGGRYSHDFKHIDNDAVHGVSGILFIIPKLLRQLPRSGLGEFTPKVSVSFRPRRSLNLYATASQGFKSGGFAASPTSLADTNPLRPEQATNFEVGAKTELARQLRLNVALFQTRYEDLQIQSFGPPAGCIPSASAPCFGEFETFNAGSAEAKGVELEADWLPVEHLNIAITYGYLDAHVQEFIPAERLRVHNGYRRSHRFTQSKRQGHDPGAAQQGEPGHQVSTPIGDARRSGAECKL